MYRPLPLATYAADWAIAGGHPAWFHALNLLWHAGVAVAVTALMLRLPSPDGRGGQGGRAAGIHAGVGFAVHPVDGEAVAEVICRGEAVAALGGCLAGFAGRGKGRHGG